MWDCGIVEAQSLDGLPPFLGVGGVGGTTTYLDRSFGGTTRTIDRVLPMVRNRQSKVRYNGRRGVGKQPLANSLNAERP